MTHLLPTSLCADVMHIQVSPTTPHRSRECEAHLTKGSLSTVSIFIKMLIEILQRVQDIFMNIWGGTLVGSPPHMSIKIHESFHAFARYVLLLRHVPSRLLPSLPWVWDSCLIVAELFGYLPHFVSFCHVFRHSLSNGKNTILDIHSSSPQHYGIWGLHSCTVRCMFLKLFLPRFLCE